jgi:hypothetical protein
MNRVKCATAIAALCLCVFTIAGCEALNRPVNAQSETESASSGRVWVDGYYRKDGTYVRGHWRSR